MCFINEMDVINALSSPASGAAALVMFLLTGISFFSESLRLFTVHKYLKSSVILSDRQFLFLGVAQSV
jgi:hypothetical protein